MFLRLSCASFELTVAVDQGACGALQVNNQQGVNCLWLGSVSLSRTQDPLWCLAAHVLSSQQLQNVCQALVDMYSKADLVLQEDQNNRSWAEN